MEPNKLDDDFRKRLDSRTIQPSEKAWDRLDAMLSVAENKKPKPKRNFKWLYMAAVFTGMLFVGTVLMEQQKEDLKIKEHIKTVEEQNHQQEQEIADKDSLVPGKETPEAVTNQKNTTAITYQPDTKPTSKAVAVRTGISNQKTHTSEVEMTTVTPPKEVQKNTTMTDVEGLLASVDKNTAPATTVPTQGSAKKQNIKVDAGSLLSTVEGEITTDYREGVFQTINRNFKTVKSAVANRNKE